MKVKEALIYQSAFPKPSISLEAEPLISSRIAYKGITKEKVYLALITQAIAKAPESNKINFRILRMIWDWDKERIISIVQQAIRLGYHPKEWKKARGILLE